LRLKYEQEIPRRFGLEILTYLGEKLFYKIGVENSVKSRPHRRENRTENAL
jgi:hypothetical protein